MSRRPTPGPFHREASSGVREALTVIGFLLILAFAALFAAPLYVDWNAWRPTIEAQLSRRLGAPVSVLGTVSAQLLPQPHLSLGRVRVGAPTGGTRLSVERVEGEINLPALLHGDVEVSSLLLDSPTLDLVAGPGGRLAPLASPPAGGVAGIDRFEVLGGTVRYADPASGRSLRLANIQLHGDAGSLAGPLQADGGVEVGGAPNLVHLALGRMTAERAGSLPVKLSVTRPNDPLTLDLDGTAAAPGGTPRFQGTGALRRPSVNTRGDREPPQEPWQVGADLVLDAASATAAALTVQVGPDERPLRLAGHGALRFGSDTQAPALQAALTATQVDLDRLAGVPPDRRLPPLQVLERVREAFPSPEPGTLPAHLTLALDGAVLGGELVSGLKADLASTPEGWHLGGFGADLPGAGHLALDGLLGGGGAAGFRGTVDLQAGQAAALVAWLQGSEAGGTGARRLALKAGVTAGPDAVGLSDLNLSIDDASATGSIGWRRLGPDGPAGRLEADLTADRLDLDTLPQAARLLGGGVVREADVRLQARALAFAGVEARSANGHLALAGDALVLDGITVDDLAGASLTADGRIDHLGSSPRGTVNATLDGRDLTGLATALRRTGLPPALVEGFATRAAALSPGSANLAVSFGDTRRVRLDGTLGGSNTQLAMELRGEPEVSAVGLSLHMTNPSGPALLRQVGLAPLPVAAGAGGLTLRLDGPLDGAKPFTLDAQAAGIGLTAAGQLTGRLDAPAVDGHLQARVPDLTVPTRMFGVGLPGVLEGEGGDATADLHWRGGRLRFEAAHGTVLGLPFTGRLGLDPPVASGAAALGGAAPGSTVRVDGQLDFASLDALLAGSLLAGVDLAEVGQAGDQQAGARQAGAPWTGTAFAAGLGSGLSGSLSVSAGTLALGSRLPAATAASATLAFEPDAVTLDNLAGTIAGGTLQGSMRLAHPRPGEASLTGHLSVADAMLRTPGLTGRLDLSGDLQGTGGSPQALVASLTGGGTLALHDPVLARLAEGAVPAVTAAADAGLPADAAHVQPRLEAGLDAGPLTARDIAGPLSLAGGVARLATVTTGSEGAGRTGLTVSGSLDLSTLDTRADLVLQPPAPADGLGGPPPAVTLAYAGPLDAVTRQVDASSLTAWLTIRAAERQAAVLEALEAKRRVEEQAQEAERRAEAERIQRNIDAARAAAGGGVVAPAATPGGTTPSGPTPSGPTPSGAAPSGAVPAHARQNGAAPDGTRPGATTPGVPSGGAGPAPATPGDPAPAGSPAPAG